MNDMGTASGDKRAGEKTAAKVLLRALAGEVCSPPPIWLMRQAGRYLPEYRALRGQAKDFIEFCLTPDLAVEATLQPIRRYGFDAAILFSDIMVIPHALGQRVWFEEGVGPRVEPVSAVSELERLSLGGMGEALAPVYETVTRLRRELPAETALIGFAGAPWTVASYMVEGGSSKDYIKIKSWAYGDPEGFQKLIDLLIEATSRYLIAQVEAGAEALQIFDSWAGALPDGAIHRWSLAPIKAIVRRVKEVHPAVPIIAFPRGAGLYYRDFAQDAEAECLAIDTAVPLDWAREVLQPQVTLQGNLDPALTVAGGPALREGVARILDRLGEGPLVFNLGGGIVPAARPENVEALVAQVREHRG